MLRIGVREIRKRLQRVFSLMISIDENQEAAKQVVIDAGCEVYVPTEDELKAFQDAVQVVYDQCVEEGIMTADELKEVQDIVANAK